jgi:hypothetical protein
VRRPFPSSTSSSSTAETAPTDSPPAAAAAAGTAVRVSGGGGGGDLWRHVGGEREGGGARFAVGCFFLERNSVRPPGRPHAPAARLGPRLRAVALQVAFERQTLKPVFHLIGYRLWV